MTRPPNDPLTNPQPGDILSILPPDPEKAIVTNVTADSVTVAMEFRGIVTSRSGWAELMQTAEVLHVAQQ